MSGIDVDVLARAMASVDIESDPSAADLALARQYAAEYDRLIAAPPDGERITDAHGDELEHGEPDYPGQFEETPRERAAREKREAG